MKLTLLLLLTTLVCQGQSDTTRSTQYSLETGGMLSTDGLTPFWFRTNQLGVVPLTGSSGFVRAGIHGKIGKVTNKRWQYTYGLNAVANAGQSTKVLLPEAYFRADHGLLRIQAGRWQQVLGVADTLLSSGTYIWSGNALPLPRVQVGTSGFAPVGFTRGWLAINANIAHGWFGNTGKVEGSYLHQKAIYFRVGKPGGSVKFIGGITHVAQWGGQSSAKFIGKDGKLPSSLTDFVYVFAAVSPPQSLSGQISTHDLSNRYGNHLGSVDFAMDWSLPAASLLVYVQRPYDDDTGVLFMNLPDGLYGVCWQNRATGQQRGFRLDRLTTEFLTTLNQSGFRLGGGHFQGADDYFNNFQYVDGWIYKDRVIGTPFFTRRADARADHQDLLGLSKTKLPIVSNRTQVIHAGLQGGWPSGVRVRALLSQSWNYGRPEQLGPIIAYPQFSGMVECTVPTPWLNGLDLRVGVAADRGQWLNNSTGGWLSLRKTGFF